MLVARDLACARGGLPVLEGVSFRLDAGGVLLVRGSNGIGKTTLLRTVAGLQPAAGGMIKAAPDAIAYAAHANGLKANLSVAENLEFWAGIYNTKGIDDALREFGLEALRDRMARNLSAGQKRRLGLARLLVAGSPIWVLDEPTMSLDNASAKHFANVVRRHCGDGGAALIATHSNLGLAAPQLDLTAHKAAGEGLDDGFEEALP